MAKLRTLFDKIWTVIWLMFNRTAPACSISTATLIHEVTSPQAFDGLRLSGRKVRHPEATLAVADHNVPTTDRSRESPTRSRASRWRRWKDNTGEFGVDYLRMDDIRQGIVHIVGPEQGFTLPGTTIVCGDSHTSTHGAFGALAFGIGTSEGRTCAGDADPGSRPAKNMLVRVDGDLPPGVTAKDLVLAIIGRLAATARRDRPRHRICGTGDPGAVDGRPHDDLQYVDRGPARGRGLIAPRRRDFDYLRGRPRAPKGAAWEAAIAYWKTLHTDDGAHFDSEIVIDASKLVPMVTWGTSPEHVLPITGQVPDPAKGNRSRATGRAGTRSGLHGTDAGHAARQYSGGYRVHRSCTNGRIEDFRAGGRGVQGPESGGECAGAGRAGLRPGQGTGRIGRLG